MKNHILLHHAIIQVWAADHGFSILPNSPEGDAFVLYKFVPTSNDPESKRIILASVRNLQQRFQYYRSKKALTIQEDNATTEEWRQWTASNAFENLKPGIHIRIGVASGPIALVGVQDDNWQEYHYKMSSFSSCSQTMVSYRGKIIKLSEKMEQRPESLNGYSFQSLNGSLEESPPIPPLVEWQRGFLHPTDQAFRVFQTQMIEQERYAVVAFVHGPLKETIQPTTRIDLIKVKRDETQMLVFYPDPKRPKPGDVGKTALQLAVTTLKPQDNDTNIGLSFGLVNISAVPFIYSGQGDTGQRTSVHCTAKDLFGDTVNLAARAAGAGLDEIIKKDKKDTNFFHYLKQSNIVLVWKDTEQLTKAGARPIVKGKNHVHTSCREKKKKSFHTINRSEINAGGNEELSTWWWNQ